jgi:hypothetical protein
MKGSLLFAICCFLFNSVAFSQTEEKSPIVQYLYKRGYNFPVPGKETVPDSLKQWPDSVYYNTAYHATLLGTPIIPLSFTRIVYVNGKYQVSPSISIGYGYSWFVGDFIFNENDKISVDPKIFFGPMADVGLQNDFSFNRLTGVFIGGFVGISAFSLFFGYDFVSNAATVGIGGRIDLYTIHQNSLKPFGKVREVRKHKAIAPLIVDE